MGDQKDQNDQRDPEDKDVTEDVAEPEEKQPEPQDKKAKSFSQEEVNKIVAREKAAWKRQQDKLLADKDSEIEDVRTKFGQSEEVIKKQVEFLMEDLELDEVTKELLAGKDVLDQFSYLSKIVEKRGKQDIPRTPRGRGKEKKEFKSTFNAGL